MMTLKEYLVGPRSDSDEIWVKATLSEMAGSLLFADDKEIIKCMPQNNCETCGKPNCEELKFFKYCSHKPDAHPDICSGVHYVKRETKEVPKLYVTKGLPASGKSSWAKDLQIREKVIRVSKDDIRAMLFGTAIPWNHSLESIVDAVEKTAVNDALARGRSVVVDATNLTEKRLKKWDDLAKTHRACFFVEDFTHVSVHECVMRDMHRPNPVGAEVIIRMAKENGLMPQCRPETCSVPGSKRKAVIFDIDGTVAKMKHRGPHDYKLVGTDEPNHDVIRVAKLFKEAGYALVFCSGRPSSCRPDTEAWLSRFFDSYDALFMRDTDDKRSDAIVKREIYDLSIEPIYDVQMVIDDRDRVVAVWRSLGLTCLQADYGNF